MVKGAGCELCMHREDGVAADEAPRRELTSVHRCTSRRFQGGLPEFVLLPTTTRAATTHVMNMTTTQTDDSILGKFVIHQPRTPPTFHGDVFHYAEDSLDVYERVARFSGWGGVRKLTHVFPARRPREDVGVEPRQGGLKLE